MHVTNARDQSHDQSHGHTFNWRLQHNPLRRLQHNPLTPRRIDEEADAQKASLHASNPKPEMETKVCDLKHIAGGSGASAERGVSYPASPFPFLFRLQEEFFQKGQVSDH